jgi:hypothetical protein
MMPRRVRLAVLLSFVLHGFLILAGQYHLSFDAYTHMFFADHYRMDWWSLWEPRWYTGFSVASYPPLVHQAMGLLGHGIGVDAAFAVVLWTVLTVYPLAVYAFSRAFTGRAVAAYAALGAAVLPSAYLAAHNFGQLPTLTATLFALFGIAALAEFLRRGDRLSGTLALALFTVVMAAHHATLLFLPWIVLGLAVHLFLNREIDSTILMQRLLTFSLLAAVAGLVVIWPFWAWGRTQGMQVAIDHLSRHNFLRDPAAIGVFFLPMYGLLAVLIPFVLWTGLQRRYTGLAIAFLPLFLLGLGGTTILPALLFRSGWMWLTYDRFAFWASLLLLPFFGVALLLLRHGLPKYFAYKLQVRFPGVRIKKLNPNNWPPLPVGRPRKWATGLIFTALTAVALGIGLAPTLMPAQPARLDMQPIVDYLAKKDPAWRYITLGFGDQLAYLSRLTKATTIDGSYHTARSLPELRESGIAQIDTVYWLAKGMRALGPIMQKSGEHGVRWAFVYLRAYIPVLEQNGWVRLTTLDNGVQVWENPDAIFPETRPAPPDDTLASFSWGVFPLFALASAAALAGMRLRPILAQKVLYRIHHLSIGLLPVALCFWYYLTLATTQIPGVYFTYTDALFFASDALGVIALLSWLIARHFEPPDATTPSSSIRTHKQRNLVEAVKGLQLFAPARLERWFLALCLLASLSVLWSVDWHISLYASLHLWLVFGVFLSLQDRPETWRFAALGFCAALALQIFIGTWQFSAQSTDFMKPLRLSWPGELDPATRGVSVVQLLDGTRWLRVYGTLPHPNILGGIVLAFLAGPVALFLLDARRKVWTVILFAVSMAFLVLTFSRSAWLGLAVAILVLIFHRLKLERKKLLALTLAALTGLILAAAPLYNLIFTRVSGTAVATEAFSIQARVWLIQATLDMIKNHPVLGVGIGAYLPEYVRHAPAGSLVEPVHNLPLLVTAELGIAGALILAALGILILLGTLRADRPGAVIFSAVLIGLCTAALFDHYLWTLAPGRMLLGLVLGLWAGQVKHADENKYAADPL